MQTCAEACLHLPCIPGWRGLPTILPWQRHFIFRCKKWQKLVQCRITHTPPPCHRTMQSGFLAFLLVGCTVAQTQKPCIAPTVWSAKLTEVRQQLYSAHSSNIKKCSQYSFHNILSTVIERRFFFSCTHLQMYFKHCFFFVSWNHVHAILANATAVMPRSMLLLHHISLCFFLRIVHNIILWCVSSSIVFLSHHHVKVIAALHMLDHNVAYTQCVHRRRATPFHW